MGGGCVDAGGDVTGAGVVVDAVGDGVGESDGLVTGIEDALGVGVAEESTTLGARLDDAVGDERKDADGLDDALGDDAEPVGHSVPLAAASASVPDAAQPVSDIW